MQITVYQHDEIIENQTNENRDYTITDILFGKKPSQDVVNSYYTKMCSIELDETNPTTKLTDMEILERVFSCFNMDTRPNGRLFRSMCIGDIVVINQQQYICARFGFDKSSYNLDSVQTTDKTQSYSNII